MSQSTAAPRSGRQALSRRTGVMVAHQPAYLPWAGYFTRLLDVDRMVLLTNVAYAIRGWQNRNWIADRHGRALRLSVPVRHETRNGPIDQVETAGGAWAERHWATIRGAYARAPHFERYASRLEAAYEQTARSTRLVEVNVALLSVLLDALELPVELIDACELAPVGGKTRMLISLCERLGATTLRVGTGSLGYLDRAAVQAAGLQVEVASYRPVAPRLGLSPHQPVSVLDALCYHGPDTLAVLARGARLMVLHQLADGPVG
jgi:hypothetical protein